MPWTPCRAPNTFLMRDERRAASMTPTSDWLMTTVGPPLWPMRALPTGGALPFERGEGLVRGVARAAARRPLAGARLRVVVVGAMAGLREAGGDGREAARTDRTR